MLQLVLRGRRYAYRGKPWWSRRYWRWQVPRTVGIIVIFVGSCAALRRLGSSGSIARARTTKNRATTRRMRGGATTPSVDTAAARRPNPNPKMLYGTAWKKERTTDLVVEAVRAGFQGIDTACQPKHYREDLVGEALGILESEYHVSRKDLWIQTKFTPLRGQDPNDLPYPRDALLPDQVDASNCTEFAAFRQNRFLVLHSPLPTLSETLAVWTRFEAAVDRGDVDQLGVSNCYDLATFREIYDRARHKPRVLQNRFYADSNYDLDLRAFCLERQIAYQTFWTLTANRAKLASGPIRQAADRLQATPPQILFAWLIKAGHQPLTGTTSIEHMRQDLLAPQLADALTDHEFTDIAALFGVVLLLTLPPKF